MPGPRYLTLGFELECLAPGDTSIYHTIKRLINSVSHQRCLTDTDFPSGTHMLRALSAGQAFRRGAWRLESDASLRPGDGWTGVEIISPPFVDVPPSSASRGETAPQRPQWKAVLADVLNTVQQEVELSTNYSTALHVHIGTSLDIPWAFADLRKLVLFFVLLEDRLDYLHPAHRRKWSQHTDTYLRSMRHSAHLADLSDRDVGRRILACKDTWELCKLVQPCPYSQHPFSRNYKVNFAAVMLHGTVEFRQHCGTVDPREVAGWAETLLALVRLALRAEEGSLLELCLSGIKVFDLVRLAKRTESFA